MSLTQRQIDLVQQSFEQVAPIADTAAQLFYGRLFELDPSLRPMFKSDMTDQRRKLMQMIAVAVHALDHLQTIIPALEAMGQRHVGYGVQPQHYAVVGEALLWTLNAGLGDAFTPEVFEAWAAVYGLIVETMLAGVEMAEPA